MDFKVGDQFCMSAMVLVYTIQSIEINTDSFICTVEHPNIDFSGKKPVVVTGEQLIDAVKLPTLEVVPPLSNRIAGMLDILNDLYKDSNKVSMDIYEKLGYDRYMPSLLESPLTDEVYLSVKCDHDRATYDSGWSKYDYCKKCDYKFKEDDK